MRPRIHFHSDCPFFAGCENMLVNFFEDEQFLKDYDVSFSYRYSQAYESGFKSRVDSKIRSFPLRLLDVSTLKERFASRPLNLLLKIMLEVLLVKYWFVIWNMIVLRRLFAQQNIDILYVNNGGYPGAYSSMSAVFAAKLCKIKKIVYVVNNIAAPYRSLRRLIDLPLDRIVVRSVSMFITGSQHARGKLIEALKVNAGKVRTINNGIRPREITEKRDDARKRLDALPQDFVIGVVAVMERRKGHIYLLRALKALRDDRQVGAMPLTLIEGDGPEKEGLVAAVREMDLEKNVTFIGNETSVFDFINAIDTLVLPSIEKEDFPNIILEAMSLAKPVVATRVAGIPEQIEDAENGLLVEPGDALGLAGAIKCLQDKRETRLELGRKAQERFEQNYSASQAVANYTRLFASLLDGDSFNGLAGKSLEIDSL